LFLTAGSKQELRGISTIVGGGADIGNGTVTRHDPGSFKMSGTGSKRGILRSLRGNVRLLALGALSAILMTACGGDDSSPPPPPGNGGGGNNNGTIQVPVAVAVADGQTVSGTNITVPSGTSTLNAELLGVLPIGSGGSAQNTGDRIQRGTTGQVLMFGTGLSGSVTVAISGPADILVSNIVTRTATDGTQGVSFDVVVDPNAALGARTVFLQSGTDQLTSFTGGLEVIP
jgi:hypothetical protein